MYSMEDIRSPRDRVSEEMLRRLLSEEECSCVKSDRQPEARREQIRPHSNCNRVSDGEALAMVYSPCQNWCGIYDPETALRRGTLFKALDKPFEIAVGNNRCSAVKGGCGCGK